MNNGLRWYGLWLLAFLGFPIGGGIAFLLAGAMENALDAALGGFIAGAIIGLLQWLVIRNRLKMNGYWILWTATGYAVGIGLSAIIMGTETSLPAILQRAPIAGAVIGIAQWIMLRHIAGHTFWWIPAMALIFVLAWYVTAFVIQGSLAQGFYVFGASGAIVHQALTGIMLLWFSQSVNQKQISQVAS